MCREFSGATERSLAPQMHLNSKGFEGLRVLEHPKPPKLGLYGYDPAQWKQGDDPALPTAGALYLPFTTYFFLILPLRY